MTILTYAQMQGYLRAAGFSSSESVIGSAIGMAESSGNTNAINWVPCVGFMQINVKAHPTWTIAQLEDPATNAQAARQVFNTQGWQAWTTYTSGAYKKYMAKATAASGGVTATIPGGILNPVQTGKNLGEVIKLAKLVDDPDTWKRALFILVGIVMVAIGIISMSATPERINMIKSAIKTGVAVA